MEGPYLSFWKLSLYVAIAAMGWLLAFAIRAWFRAKCRWSHKKKYVRIDHWTNIDCEKHGRHVSHGNNVWWSKWGVWICEEPGCTATGKDCFGESAEWTIEFGQVVIDEKKMANLDEVRGNQIGPRQAVDDDRAKEQGLPKAVHANEAIKAIVDLAVALKKGEAKVTEDKKEGADGKPEGPEGSQGSQA